MRDSRLKNVTLSLVTLLGAVAAPVGMSCAATLPQGLLASSIPAVTPAGETISDIRVEGVERLEASTVTSRLTLAKGDLATPARMDESLKALYASGLFSDIRMKMDGSVLVVKVDENAIINRVVFEGNDAISKEDLEKEVQIKPRQVYTLPKVQHDVQRIIELYRRSGRFSAVVEPKMVKLEQNRIDLIFEITEGERTGIRNIKFIGNSHYDADELSHVVSTRESAWWRFFSSTDYFDPDRMNYDKELLRKFYLNGGYVDFRVVSAVAELTPNHGDFFMTFTLDEGARYKFGKILVKSDIKGLNTGDLDAFVTIHEGDWYSAEAIEKTITRITAALGDRQYAFANVIPTTDRHKESQSVDVTLDIKQGERVYVGRIDISGNNRTVDKVIRREIPLAEGDPFSASKVHKAEQKLKDLGFFEEAKVTPVEGAQPDRANLKVEVKEKSTGEVSLGAGFSSTDGPLGDFNISEHNFMGKGQDARFGATISGRTKQLNLSLTEPHFLDRNLSLGGDIFRTQTDNQDLSSYNTTATGFNVRTGFPLSEELRQSIAYSFHADRITNVPTTASAYIADQAGASVTSAIGQVLTYDTRDSRLEPTEGFITHFDTDVAGLGGTRKYVRVRFGGTQYYSIADKWVINGTAEAGQIWSLSGPTKINERFFLGGDTLRGFQYAGFGPRDLTSTYSDALGGTRFTRGSVELDTPTPLPVELGLVGHVFVDAGTLGHLDQSALSGTATLDESLHVSAGVGVTWASPFGPVRLDFAEPLMKKAYDKLEHIHFSFGTKF